MVSLTLQAPAKLNLFLHVLGRRTDGYHTIETLVAFTQLADTLSIEASETLSLHITGAFADHVGNTDSNLVTKAAKALQQVTGAVRGAALTLTKNIPVGAGLGGGSADAAAALRGLNRFWNLGLNQQQLLEIGKTLGADVPMCLLSVPALARGIGAELVPLLYPLPPLHAVLVHPCVPLLTADVYAALQVPPRVPVWQPVVDDMAKTMNFLRALSPTHNHLQRAAISVSSQVAELLLALETLVPSAPFVRMTGSGACCYALFEAEADALRAAQSISKQYPQWWVKATYLRPE